MKKLAVVLLAAGVALAADAKVAAPLISVKSTGEKEAVSPETEDALDAIDSLRKQGKHAEANRRIKSYLGEHVESLTVSQAEKLLARFDLRATDNPAADIREICSVYHRLSKQQKTALKTVLRQIKTKYNLLKNKREPEVLGEVEATKVDTTKVDTTKVDTTKVDTTKVDTTKVDTTKVDTTKVDTTPVDLARGWANVYGMKAQHMGSFAQFSPEPRSYFGFKYTRLRNRLVEAEGEWWDDPELLAEWEAYWKKLGAALRRRYGE